MIPKSELRIGNYIYAGKNGWANEGDIEVVRTINNDGVNDWQDMSASGVQTFESIQPIPITEGLYKTLKLEHRLVRTTYDFRLNLDSTISVYAYQSGVSAFIQRISYVHQLQNLFFWLTNEELEIRL